MYLCLYIYIYYILYIYYIYIYIYMFIYMIYIYIYIYICYSPLKDSLKQLWKVGLSGIWNHNHWIPFWRSNQLSYQAMSSARTHNQLCTAIPTLSFVQCQVSFRLLPLSADTSVLIEIIWRNHMCENHRNGGKKWWKKNNDPWKFLCFSVNNNIFHNLQKFVWLRYTLFLVGFLGLGVKLPLSVYNVLGLC